jgi:hypothetical protein
MCGAGMWFRCGVLAGFVCVLAAAAVYLSCWTLPDQLSSCLLLAAVVAAARDYTVKAYLQLLEALRAKAAWLAQRDPGERVANNLEVSQRKQAHGQSPWCGSSDICTACTGHHD